MKQEKNKLILSGSAKEKINIFNKYNDLVESIRGMLFEGVGYEEKDGFFYNKAYFSVGENISKEYIEKKVNEASEKIKQLEEVKKDLEKENILNDTQKKLIYEKINSTIDSLEYHKNTIYIEAEKTGFEIDPKEIDLYNDKKLEIEQRLFGDDITKLEFRKNKVIRKLKELYDKYPKEKITDEEKQFRSEKIDPLFQGINNEDKSGENNMLKEQKKDVYVSEKTIFPLIETLLQMEGFSIDDYIKIEVSKDESLKEAKEANDENGGIYIIPKAWKAKEIYDYFKNKGLGQRFKIIKKTSGNNSVSIVKEGELFKKNEINLEPAQNGKYNLSKILNVIFDHETSTHVNTGIGNFFNLNLIDPERGDLEEAVAIVNERFSKGGYLESVYETSKGDVCQFLGEIFDDEDLKQAVSIYFKLSGDAEDVESRFRRIRMGVAKGKKGSRRKDLTYGNSKELVRGLEELTKTPEGVDMLNRYARVIYGTKLGYKAMQEVDKILDGIIEIEKLEPNFPIFAGKIIYRKLFKGKLDTDEMLRTDLRSIIKTDKTVTYAQKRLLLKILQIIQQDSEYKKSINQSE